MINKCILYSQTELTVCTNNMLFKLNRHLLLVINLFSTARCNINNGGMNALLFIDLTKAFDSISYY